jgi:hypothetical protein
LQVIVINKRGGPAAASVMQAPPSAWELGGQTSGVVVALVSAGAGGGFGAGAAGSGAGGNGIDLAAHAPLRNSCQGKQRSAGSESCAHPVPGPQRPRPRQSPNGIAAAKRVIPCPVA